ncbi:MAG: ATP-binding protein [Kofleriaceae bacterium]
MKLRGRFTLTLALAALVPISVAAIVTRQVIASSAREEYNDRRRSAETTITNAVDRLTRQVQENVMSLASRDHPYVAGMVLDMMNLDGRRLTGTQIDNYQQQGKSWMKGLFLQVLTITDDTQPENLVVVSAHLRSAQNERNQEVRTRAELKPDVPFFALEVVQLPDDVPRPPSAKESRTILVIEAARVLSSRLLSDRMSLSERDKPPRSVGVLAGREVSADFLSTVYLGRTVDARIVKPNGQILVPPKGTDWAQLASDPPIRLELPGADGKPFAIIEVAVSDGDLDTVLRKLTYTSAGLALAALGAVVLIGLLVARRTARDLDALVEGSLAASRGDLDHRVPVRSKDEVGAVAHAFNFMMEDLRTSKDRLVIAERIAAWQEIARRLAHEIKNPLTPIQMAMDTLRKTHRLKHPSFDEILEESTTTVLQEADRLKHIVAEFSDFARMPKPNFQRIDLNEVVRSAMSLYQGAAPVETKLTELPQLDADKGQVSQVVLNLVENARDAIAKRPDGKVTVSTKLGDAGDRALLVVEDNGPGIPTDLKDKVFAPYFTTKHNKGGTGLGLAIVHRIVSDHGGRIQVSDIPGGGARFAIELPLRNGTALLVSRI